MRCRNMGVCPAAWAFQLSWLKVVADVRCCPIMPHQMIWSYNLTKGAVFLL